MSGIAGLFHRTHNSGVSRDDIDRMLAAMPHRGPDGAKCWISGAAGFGHAMLHTTPESLIEVVPFVTDDGRIVYTGDARIDNREELAAELSLNLNQQPVAVADSELIVAAYRKWDDRCVDHLIGDFAFAIYDSEKHGVFSARDHFGVKPFYYCITDEWFAFASEQKALLGLEWVDASINGKRVEEMILSISNETQSTFYAGISRLSPAHVLFVDAIHNRTQRYWCLDPKFELRLPSDEAYAKRFREIFVEAVRCRLRSAYPIGAFLSGGLDSSSIVSVAAPVLTETGAKLHTYSKVYSDVPQCDEREYMNKVLEKYDAEPHFLDERGRDPFQQLLRLSQYQDEPVAGPGMYSTSWLCGLAASTGSRILLDGHDGDSTVSHGFGYLVQLAQERQWRALWSHCGRLGPSYGMSPLQLFWSYFEPLGIAPFANRHSSVKLVRRVWFGLLRRLRSLATHRSAASAAESPDVTEWDLLGAVCDDRREELKRLVAAQSGSESEVQTEREDHFATLTQPSNAWALESLNNTASAVGIEPRYPFFDKRLVEFCLSLPPELKIRNGWGRWILRSAMDGILPPEIQWRPGKTDFSDAMSTAAIVDGADSLRSIVEPDAKMSWPFLNSPSVLRLYQQFTRVPTKVKYRVLYPVIAVLAWYRCRNIGHASVSNPSPGE